MFLGTPPVSVSQEAQIKKRLYELYCAVEQLDLRYSSQLHPEQDPISATSLRDSCNNLLTSIDADLSQLETTAALFGGAHLWHLQRRNDFESLQLAYAIIEAWRCREWDEAVRLRAILEQKCDDVAWDPVAEGKGKRVASIVDNLRSATRGYVDRDEEVQQIAVERTRDLNWLWGLLVMGIVLVALMLAVTMFVLTHHRNN